jgi:hypothetical protein
MEGERSLKKRENEWLRPSAAGIHRSSVGRRSTYVSTYVHSRLSNLSFVEVTLHATKMNFLENGAYSERIDKDR